MVLPPGTTLTILSCSGTLTGTFGEGMDEGVVVTVGTNNYILHYLTSSVTLTTAATNTFANWMSTNYPGLVSPDNQPGADPDHDGLTNLVEYALNTNPTTSSQPPGTRVGSLLTFTKGTMAKADSNITYSIEESTDLVTWGPATLGTAVNGADTITYTFPSGQTKVFARLKVVQTP